MRKIFTQLPKKEELENILKKEAKRDVPRSKQNIHYPDFTSIINIFDFSGLPSGVFTDDIKMEFVTNEFIKNVEKKIELVSKKILVRHYDIDLLNNLFDYLSKEDVPERSDFIFVFGFALKLRMNKAIELYNQNFSKLIVVSGSKAFYDDKEIILSEELKKYAISKGVSEKNIITEKESVSIPDNVKSSLNLLDNKKIIYKKVILINSPYAQRRGWSHFNKFSDNVIFYRVNANSLKFGRDNWFKTTDGIKLIINEFIKMKIAVILNTA